MWTTGSYSKKSKWIPSSECDIEFVNVTMRYEINSKIRIYKKYK
ncbi:hypothetical protein LBBP_03225 [Leptospira borgpetersenii serovar Ballum]|uniref:Uncharacterized protein n=1 Tax=Leptospira borgpetersenii serovar Ballum TaxID=280505 RepID=A0A0S2IUV8_LEPBO|nr:hypothetical protein LBBP_03225 [Leptospira borgpetersenii serovar Ballum]